MDENTLVIDGQLTLPRREIGYRYSHSGGPGGQHVNKSETQVELVWDVRNSPSLSEEQRALITTALARRIDGEGVLHLVAGGTRSQERNRQAVTERLALLLAAALHPPHPRRPTRVAAAERARRLAAKRRRSEVKRSRAAVQADE
ncbi:MAG: aminoacyl-tRNA hydrolase [Caldilineales bacterium]|nr:aminoacyl-tRNA hydrolase [Caldilineales bacterium]MCW5861387.1 aminoacyl-tRNA hydrolase [Caldilineales bacterium]